MTRPTEGPYEFRKVDGEWQRRKLTKRANWYRLVITPDVTLVATNGRRTEFREVVKQIWTWKLIKE